MQGIQEAQGAFSGFQNTVSKGAEALKKGLAVLGGAAVVAGGAIAKNAVDAAYAADDLNTLSKQTGISTEELQKFKYASDLIDVSLDTFTGSLTKLIRNMNSASKGTGTAGDAFNALGISITNADGSLRNNQEVFYEAIDALADIENYTERDALAMEIFGRSAQDLNPLILGGSDALKELGQQAQDAGLILSQDALDGLNELSDALDTAKATFSSFGNVLGTAFASDIAKGISAVNKFAQEATSAFTDGFQLDGIEGALSAVGDMISSKFTGIIENVSSAGAEITGAFEGFTGSIDTIAGSMKSFIDAFSEADFGTMDGVAAAAKQFFEAVGEAAIDKFEAVAGLIPAFLDAFKNADIAGTMGEIAQNAQGLFSSFLTASAKVITEVTAGVVAFTDGFKDGGGAEALAKVAKSAGELFNSFLIASDTTISAIGTGIRNFLKGFDDYAVGEAVAKLASACGELFDAVSSTSGAALEDVARGVAALAESSKAESAGKGASDLAAAFAELGAHVSESLATAIRSVGEAFSGMGQKLGEVVARFGPDIGALGSSLGEFLSVCTTAAQGIVDALQPAWDWINRVFREALQGALTFAIGLVGALVDAFTPLIDIFSNTLSAVINAFKGNWEGVFEDMKSAGMSFVDFVGSLVDLIKRPFEALIPQMQQIGSDIITGLWNGLMGMWDSVSGWFNEKVGGLVSGAKKLLGIGSPSKVFAEIGRFTVQGMEVGWGKEFGRLEDQVAEDIGALSGTARLPFEDSAIGRSSAAGISSMLAANGSGRSTDPIEINLILDGDVAATALYDPLRRTAFQRGQNVEAVYA